MNDDFTNTVMEKMKQTPPPDVPQVIDEKILEAARIFASGRRSHHRHILQFIYATGALAASVLLLCTMVFFRHNGPAPKLSWDSNLSSELSELKVDIEISSKQITVSRSSDEEIKKLFTGE